MARRRSQGIGFGGLLVVIGLLYFTGAGAWLWDRIKAFDENCYEILTSLGTDMGGAVCRGAGAAIRAADNAANGIGDSVRGIKERFQAFFTVGDFGSFTQQLVDRLMQGTSPLNGWVSPSDKLAGMMQGQPVRFDGAANLGDRIRASLDNFVIGQHYLHSGSAGSALPWLQQGAQQPGYGVLSQLALGDLYRNGATDVAADPVRARYYYQQAQQSLAMLSTSSTPESAQMLQSLPVSPAQIQKQLTASIGELNAQITKR